MNMRTVIRDVMTPMPHLIEITDSIDQAKEMMDLYGIRHLPVQRSGELVGILSQRNVYFALGIQGRTGSALTVEDVYIPDPYLVDGNARLAEVLEVMASERYGSALVRENGELIGIFTTTDACRVFSDFLYEGSEEILAGLTERDAA